MRFLRGFRFNFTDTPRKRAAVLVRQRKDREKLPLFADMIAAEQPSVDEVIERREAGWARSVQAARDRRAAEWWRARRLLAELEEPARSALLAYWNAHRWLPGDPGYLAGEIHSFKVGRMVLVDGQIRSAAAIEWEQQRDAKIRAMTDADLDHMIQTHTSMQFVELGRAERARRQIAGDRP